MLISTRNPKTMSDPELRDEIDVLQGKLGKAIAQMGADYDAAKITIIDGTPSAKAQWVHDANDRYSDLTDEWGGRSDGGSFPPDGGPRKGLGELFIRSRAGYERKGAEVEIASYGAAEFKADFATTAGWAPQSVRSGRVAVTAQQQPTVLDLMPIVGTNESNHVYMEETTYTSGAAETAEGGTFGEGALALTEREVAVRKIAVFLPVTDEQLADVAQAREYVQSRLGHMIRERLDSQILTGNGTAPNISGFLDHSINTQAKGADSILDAILKGMTQVRDTGYAEPDAIVTTPGVWEAIRLLTTTDGSYLMGSPAEAGPRSLFGLPVITTTAMSANTALVGAFGGHSALVMRQGLDFRVSDSHSDYFAKGKQAIRAQLRAALAVYRPAAFTQVTGLS